MSILCATARIEAAAGLQEQEGRVQIGQVVTQLDEARALEIWFDPRSGTIMVEAPCGCRHGFSLAQAITLDIKSALEHTKGAGDGTKAD